MKKTAPPPLAWWRNRCGYWGILLVSMLGVGLFWLLLHYRRQLAARFPAAVLAVVLGFSFVYGQVHLSITKYGQWYHDADYVQQTWREAPELNAVLPDDVFTGWTLTTVITTLVCGWTKAASSSLTPR